MRLPPPEAGVDARMCLKQAAAEHAVTFVESGKVSALKYRVTCLAQQASVAISLRRRGSSMHELDDIGRKSGAGYGR